MMSPMTETDPASVKVAIITGAGSGVGRDAAVLLAEAGWAVVLAARTRAHLEQTADLIRREFGDDAPLLVHPCDVSDADQVRGLIDAAVDAFGRLDALCNVAGAAPLGPIDDITPEAWRACIDTNLTSVVLATAAAWPVFRQQQSGVIVNISSMASIDPFPGFAMYAAAKVGVNLFTRCTAEEGQKFGVSAVAIAPGAIETPMLRENFPERMIPKDKTLDPAEIAAAIRDCVTGGRDCRPGETIVMDSPK